MPIKPILTAKRLIKGRPLTASELGYKRQTKTVTPGKAKKWERPEMAGKLYEGLTRPGQEKFNEKIEFTKGEKEDFVKLYKKKIRNANNQLSKDILEQKLQDRRNQYNNKLETIRDIRKREISRKEKARLADLKKRQLKDWIKKLDTVLKTSRKGTVQEIKEKLFQELFAKEIDQIKKRAILSKSAIKAYEYIHSEFTTDFYEELHKTYVPTNLSKMGADSISDFLRNLSIRIKRRKDETIYSDFKTGKFKV